MNTAIEKTNNKKTSIVMPAVSAEEAVNAFNAYQELAKKITTPDDVQNIQGKEFKKKSFWRKCQRFFNLSLELISERREDGKNGSFTYFVMYKAIAPNGAFMDGDGACTSNEKNRIKSEHDTRATAHTRAKNRAIADLVAFGEVTAEEIVVADNGHDDPDWIKEGDNKPVSSPPTSGKCPECGTTGRYHRKGCAYAK